MGSEGHVIEAVVAIAILGIGGWSIFAMVRIVIRDAFEPAQEVAAGFRSTDVTRADGP